MVAVLAGALTGIILSLATDSGLRAAGIFPSFDQRMSDGLLALAIFYRTVYGVAGSYITARLAPYRPMAHSLVLGSLGFVVVLVGLVATWNKGPQFEPHWYPMWLIVLAIPTAWAGARLREMQLSSHI
jgi:hypothetical protein